MGIELENTAVVRPHTVEYPVTIEESVVEDGDDRFIFRTKARIADLLTVEQEYEVFPESVVFCEFSIFLDPGKEVNIRNAEMNFLLDVLNAKKLTNTPKLRYTSFAAIASTHCKLCQTNHS